MQNGVLLRSQIIQDMWRQNFCVWHLPPLEMMNRYPRWIWMSIVISSYSLKFVLRLSLNLNSKMLHAMQMTETCKLFAIQQLNLQINNSA